MVEYLRRNTIYQGVLLQSVYGQLPPRSWSTIACHYSPQWLSSAAIRIHHQLPPRSWSTTTARCQHDKGSAIFVTTSQHDCHGWGEDPSAAPADGKSHRAEQESNQEGTGELVVKDRRLRWYPGQRRGRLVRDRRGRQQAISPGKNTGESGIIRQQSGTEAEPGAGLNAARLSQVWSV